LAKNGALLYALLMTAAYTQLKMHSAIFELDACRVNGNFCFYRALGGFFN
jgi:hypothetical protein